jgi:dTDP-4-amino-4,6-dideoxygalactose transaminase
MIPFYRYSVSAGPHADELLGVIENVLQRGAFILQRDLEQFELHLAEYLGVGTVLGVANGTDAIMLALRAAGIGLGDEVILPAHTYVATAAAVHFLGATPVVIDCGPDHLVDPEAVEGAVTSRTRALIPVHLNGRTCDMDALMKLADSYGLMVVEDAAQAVGSRYKSRPAGTFGVAGTFSFYPAKVLGCFGDGGAVVTTDTQLAHQLSLLRDHGRDAEGEVVTWGLNSRLDNLQAAVLDFKLRHLPEEIGRRYHCALSEISELALPPGPDEADDRFDVYQNYEIEADRRDELRLYLQQHGVSTIIQWGGRAIHQVPELGIDAHLPETERLFRRCLMLPMNTSLSDSEVDQICSSVRQFHGLRG